MGRPGHDRAAPVPVPPPMPAVMNTMCRLLMRISSITSSAARDFRLWPPEGLPSPDAHLDYTLRLGRGQCLSVCVDTTNSTPSRPDSIMLFTALPPAPPTPNTVICGLSSRMSELAD